MSIYQPLEVWALDNTICEYAISEGFAQVLFDSKLYNVFLCEEFGADWKEAE